jgi:hypothetical protein
MDPQGASGQTALLHKAEMSFNRRSPVGYLTRSRNWSAGLVAPLAAIGSESWVRWKVLGVPQDRRRSCTRQRYASTEGHPSEIMNVQHGSAKDHHGYAATCSRRVSNSLLLSKVPPRPTWYSPLASLRISATAAREARPPSRCFLRWYQALAMGSF